MQRNISWGVVLTLALVVVGMVSAQAGMLKCVGLYSEMDLGHVSYRLPCDSWKIISLGETIPVLVERRVNVGLDWFELRPSNSIDKVYEIDGPDSGAIVKTVAEILRSKPKIVEFPRGTRSNPDPCFKNQGMTVPITN